MTKFLVTLLLVVAGCNLHAAIDGSSDSPAERFARVVLCIIGVATAWPHISEERPR